MSARFILLFLCGLNAAARPRVVVALRDAVTTLNPFAPATIEGYRLGGLIFEPLARVDPRTNELVPWLATRWTRLPRGRGLRVELRADVKFHDGRALTAEDVRHTLNAFRSPANRAATWRPLWADVDRVRVIAPLTLEFRTRRLTYETLRNILTTLRIQPRHRGLADLVGTGPFSRATFRGDRVEFTSHPGWWHAPAPDFDVTFRPVADAGLARDLISRGDLDLFALGGAYDAAATAAGPGEGLWLDLNLRREPFSNSEVRRALLLLWNRTELNQKLFHDGRRVALDTFDPSVAHYPPGEPSPYDPEAARALLNKNGWHDVDGRLTRRGRELAFEVLVSHADEERWVSLLQASLARSGIRLTIKRAAMDGEWWRRVRQGDYDAAAGAGPLSPGVNADAWTSRGAYNGSGLRDESLDRVLRELNLEFEPLARAKLERAAMLKLREHLAQLPGLIAPRGSYLRRARLSIDADAPEDVWRWRVTDAP